MKELRPFLIDSTGARRTICFDVPHSGGPPACCAYEDKVVELHDEGYTPIKIAGIIRRLGIARTYQAAVISCLKRKGIAPRVGSET
jgi:hypothetical protein